MVQKMKAQIGVQDESKVVAKLIKATPEWLTLKEPGKRPYRIRRATLTSISSLDSPEELQVALMEEMIKSTQPGYKKPGTIEKIHYY